MMKKSLLLLMMVLVSAFSFAQDRKISGVLVDGETKEPVMQTTVQLITMDSAFVAGAVSNERGAFTITAPKNGKYLLRISSIGYIGVLKRLEIVGNKNLNLGIVKMESDAKMLSQVNVTGKALKVVVKEDTFVYNSAAYVTPEGSVVEELVKRLPGAQVSEDGKITINGKEVKKVKVGGKEFMTGDTQTAMKNLPTSIIDNIKVYDEKSDLSRITGIDDGNDETVLDFSVKPGMNKGFMSNVDLGYGTHDRYTGRLFGMYTGQGLNSSKMAGFNFSYDNDTIQIGGSVRWNHRDGDVMSRRAVENFVSRSGAFENSVNQNFSRSDSWNAQLRLEWKPDTMTNIMFRPSMSISSNDGLTSSSSANFNEDPFRYFADPLAVASIAKMAEDSIIVNSSLDKGINYSNSKRFGGSLQFNRKLNSLGRNITFRVEGNYSKGDGNNLSISNVHLYKVRNVYGEDSTYQTNRYSITPTKNYSYSLQTIYSEPLWRGTFLQLSYLAAEL